MVAEGVAQKVITLEEVSKHTTESDAWLVIHGKVYDVTKFLEEHPGGDEVLLTSTAKDATEDFDDVGHSDSARDMLKDYYIGEFDTSSLPAKVVAARAAAATRAATKSGEETGLFRRILQILVPLGILALAIAVRFLTAKDPVAVAGPSRSGQPETPVRDERGTDGKDTAAPGSGGSAAPGEWVRRSGPFLGVMVCNHKCRSAQFLKTQCLAPDAEADDGSLDLMLVKPVGRVDLVRFLTLLQFSKHVDLPYVEYRKVKAVRILPNENDNRSCGIDGELLPLVGPASMSVIPRLFKMMGRSQWDV